MIELIEKLKKNLIGKPLNFLELDEKMGDLVNSPSEYDSLSENQINDTDNHFKIHFALAHESGDDEVLSTTCIKVTDITFA